MPHNLCVKKAGGHIDRNVVEITIKMKTIVRKTLMKKYKPIHDELTTAYLFPEKKNLIKS